jgi:hypothetical protein
MKTCFVIAPIGQAGSETRKRSDVVLRHLIAPAVEQCGYVPLRADQIAEPGLITSHVIQHIIDDPLVVADLTERNPNVFYELAIRHAIRKPLVQIIESGEQLPFDVAGTRTITVDHRDLDNVAFAKGEIVKQIDALEKKAQEIETPISIAVELKFLRQSDKPAERSLAEILSSLTEIKTELGNVQKLGVMDRERMMDVFDHTANLMDNMLRDFYRRFEQLLENQQKLFENLEEAIQHDGTSTYVPEENASTIARYLQARLPSKMSVSDEVANQIATMLMEGNKADAVRRLARETGLDEEVAKDVLTQVNVQRSKDDLLRSVRIS